MKLLMSSLAMSLSIVASDAMAEITLKVDGQDYTLSALMENCQSLADDPSAQIACFSAVSKLVEDQAGAVQQNVVSVPDALEALRDLAEYEDELTGLSIAGTGCKVEILYYNNYFHISRRNVSSIDLYSATFDASKLQYDEVSEVRGAQAPLYTGVLDDGSTAKMLGGVALESSQLNFEPKSARMSIGDYAVEVADQLETNEGEEFDFVLVHPAKEKSNAKIWSAFETFVEACKR